MLVANRGEIAARILRSVKALGLKALLVAHSVDRKACALDLADDVRWLDGDTPVSSFLDAESIIGAAHQMKADAVHPGYGFLSENAAFARAVAANDMIFVGPSPDTIELMGNKVLAKKFVENLGLPVSPSAVEGDERDAFVDRARAIGFPLLVKPVAGGGGKGMRIVRSSAQLDEELARARSEGERYFGDGRIYVERYVERPRHIEVQVIGDSKGNVVHLFERECSLQRRFQKIVEEAPSTAISEIERERICGTAVRIAKEARYTNAGTIEFIYGRDGELYFLEMNTRLQVEHPVTEAITGIDIVAEQIRISFGEALSFGQEQVVRHGHAIELRICAEDPARDFMPTTGPILRLDAPHAARFDAGVQQGADVTAAFDPMIGKLIVHADDRATALKRARQALSDLVILGVRTNIEYLERLLGDPDVMAGALHTGLIDEKIELRADPPVTARQLGTMLAASAINFPELRRRADATKAIHAEIGRWRN